MEDFLPIEYDSYYLTAPFTFEKKRERINIVPEGYTLLKTLKTGICASDLHYYLGLKSKEKLKERLPLLLLHEGICEDVIRGSRVVPVAMDLTTVDSAFKGRENIYPKANYMGSTAQGMARQYFLYPESLLIPVSPMIDSSVATLVEPLSIVLKAIKDVDIRYHQKVAIIGDGGLAYLFALMLNVYSNISPKNITIYGVHDEKLAKFAQLGTTINSRSSTKQEQVDVILEVVGGKSMQSTLDLAFQLAGPGAVIGVVGVSDEYPQINANKIVNQR